MASGYVLLRRYILSGGEKNIRRRKYYWLPPPTMDTKGRSALCSSVESSVSDSCRKGSTDEYLVIYYD